MVEESRFQFFGNAFFAAVEEVTNGYLITDSEEFPKEVRPIDATHVRFAEMVASDPDEGDAVGGAKKGMIENILEGGIVLGFDDTVDACDADIAFYPGADGVQNGVGGGMEVEDGNVDAENIYFIGGHGTAGAGELRKFGGSWTKPVYGMKVEVAEFKFSGIIEIILFIKGI